MARFPDSRIAAARWSSQVSIRDGLKTVAYRCRSRPSGRDDPV